MSRTLRNARPWVSLSGRGLRTSRSSRAAVRAQRASSKRPSSAIAGQDFNSITFISQYPESVLQAALEVSEDRKARGQALSAIDGQLIGVKDNICTTDLPTTCGSNILRDFISPIEATVVKKLRDNGGIISGKANLDEFGMGSHSVYSAFGATYNPIVKRELGPHSAGGSSGGSAAAVAEGSCSTALGTDTGGSVRLPAALCGVVGFKPSYGQLSRYGVVAYANSLDTVGVLGRNVEDVHALYHCMNGPDEHDPTCLKIETRERIQKRITQAEVQRGRRHLRIGVPIQYRVGQEGDFMDAQVMRAWSASLNKLLAYKDLSFELVPVSLPSTKLALPAYYIIAPAEAASNLAKYDGVRYGSPSTEPRADDDVLYAATRAKNLGPEVRRRILLGAYSLSSTAIDNYFIQAQKVRRLVQHDFNEAFAMLHPLISHDTNPDYVKQDGVDLLLTPTAPTRAPSIGDISQITAVASYVSDVFTVPASLAGLPAISVPVITSEAGFSIGMQLVGQYGDDDFVLEIAQILETITLRD